MKTLWRRKEGKKTKKKPFFDHPLFVEQNISVEAFYLRKLPIESSNFVSRMDIDSRQYDNIAINENDTHKIILSYLVHSCYNETMESFITCAGMRQSTLANCIEDMDKRKRILNFTLNGNVLKAIELTEQLAPDLLEKNEDLHFDLLSLHFMELICSRRCTEEALEFAWRKLTSFGKVQKYVEKLEDFMALVAYDEPEKSPMFHLLSPDYRQQVADNLNRAILAYSNLPSYSSLERLIQQTTIVRQHLNQDHGKDGSSEVSLKDFLKS